MFVRVVKRVIKAIIVMMLVIICACAALVFIGMYLSPPDTPDQDHQPPVYSKVPAIFYVGTHAFKVPADYSFLSVSDYGGPGNPQLIFDIYYPDFTPEIDEPRLANLRYGVPAYDNADLTLYVQADDTDISPATTELQAIKAGTTTDRLRPGPYQLLEVHQKDDSTWISTREYIGIFDGTTVDISCGNPDVLLRDGTRDDICIGLFSYENLSLEEDFSVVNLKYWQNIIQKTIDFLATHEVK